MKKEELIEELEKLEGVFAKSGYFELSNDFALICYTAESNRLGFTTNYRHEQSDENTKYCDNLESETILDLFRKWKQ